MVGGNRQALVTKNVACGYEATKAWTNVPVVVIEQAKPPVSTRTQISEKCRGVEEEVFECREGVVQKMWVDESGRLREVGKV
jgi:hypothetical protein